MLSTASIAFTSKVEAQNMANQSIFKAIDGQTNAWTHISTGVQWKLKDGQSLGGTEKDWTLSNFPANTISLVTIKVNPSAKTKLTYKGKTYQVFGPDVKELVLGVPTTTPTPEIQAEIMAVYNQYVSSGLTGTIATSPSPQTNAWDPTWARKIEDVCEGKYEDFTPGGDIMYQMGDPANPDLSIALKDFEFIFRFFRDQNNQSLLDSNQSILSIQKILGPDIVSQTMSQDTNMILKQYQNKRGIQEDGIIGRQTSRRMALDIGAICARNYDYGNKKAQYDPSVVVDLTKDSDTNSGGTDNTVYWKEPKVIFDGNKVTTDGGEPLFVKADDGSWDQATLNGKPIYALADNSNISNSVGSNSGNGDKPKLSLIPSNPGVISWYKISGGSQFKGDKIAKGLAFKILDWVLGFIAILAVIMLSFAGIRYITSAGNPEGAKSATKTIQWAAAGLVLVMLAESVVRIVFPTKGSIRDITGDTGLDPSQVFETADSGSNLIISVLNWGLGFIAVLAVAMVIYSGFLLITARGAEEQQKTGTKMLMQSVIGLLIVMLAFAIVNIFIKGLSSL